MRACAATWAGEAAVHLIYSLSQRLQHASAPAQEFSHSKLFSEAIGTKRNSETGEFSPCQKAKQAEKQRQ